MSITYRSITPARVAAADKKSGYSDKVYLALHSKITVWAATLSDGTPGATKRIPSSHTIDGGVLTIQAKMKSVQAGSATTGEVGGVVINYQPKFIIKGDDAFITEFVENMLNEDLVIWVNDPTCGTTKLVQYGSQCTAANISAAPFKSGSRGEGGVKEWEITVDCPDKFFYEGDLTESVDDSQLAAPQLNITNITISSAFINWPDVANATDYEVEFGTDPTFVTVAQTTTEGPSEFALSGRVDNTQYWVRVRATAAGFVKSAWSSISFVTLPD